MNTYNLIAGDSLRVLPTLPDSHFDSIVTDPPYGISFMGKAWDHGVPSVAIWRECYRVLKPGGYLLSFAGTRTYHRMAVNIEDAGFEVRDMIGWMYGSGFPKSHNISKALDRMAGAEREVVGVKRASIQRNGTGEAWKAGAFASHPEDTKQVPITAPATPAAIEWDGWGTALKPSFEPVVWALKPLTVMPLESIIQETFILLEGAICLLLSSVNDVEKILALSHQGQQGQSIVAVSAALLDGHESGELYERMDTFNSRETASTCLSIVKLWSVIWGEVLSEKSMFTTSTETEAITGLKTLNCLLSAIIPDYIIRDVSQASGLQQNAHNAGKNSSGEKENWKAIQKHFAGVLATWKTEQSGTIANIAAKGLQLIIPSVSSVMQNVITILGASPDISPNLEPLCMARKPLSESTVAANVLKWGTGGINVDGCRVKHNEPIKTMKAQTGGNKVYAQAGRKEETTELKESGRFPANLIHDGSDEVLAGFPETGGGGKPKQKKRAESVVFTRETRTEYTPYNDTMNGGGSAARFFYMAKASKQDRDAGLGSIVAIMVQYTVWNEKKETHEEGKALLHVVMGAYQKRVICVSGIEDKSGIEWNTALFGNCTMERFQEASKSTISTGSNLITKSKILNWLTSLLTSDYIADVNLEVANGGSPAENAEKSSTLTTTINERMASALGAKSVALGTQLKISVKDGRNNHSTVKPTDLMRYLCRLVTPPNGHTLDPFCGSGSTGRGAMLEGFDFTGIDLDPHNIAISEARINEALTTARNLAGDFVQTQEEKASGQLTLLGGIME